MSDNNHLKEAAKEKSNEAIKEVKNATSSVYENVKDNAESFTNQVHDTVADYYSEGKKKVEQAIDVTRHQKDYVMEQIKDKPLTSVLIAAGVGYLLSQFIKNNSNN